MAKYILIVFVCLLIFLNTNQTQAAVRAGDVAPDFTLVDTNGNQFKLSDKRGSVIVLFWMGFS
jgi:cytochrome oxidase Cu insertion factor (SCO1/SenC/PrrC family)